MSLIRISPFLDHCLYGLFLGLSKVPNVKVHERSNESSWTFRHVSFNSRPFVNDRRRLRMIMNVHEWLAKVYYANLHSPFHSPFLKGEWASGKKITLQKGWTYSPMRVNHPQKGWITLLKGELSRSLSWKRVNERWITLLKG